MESTLAVQLDDLQATVGTFLGYGRGSTFGDPAWSSQQAAVIDDLTRSGIRQVNVPPRLDGEGVSYDWSWLKPVARLNLAAAANTVPCPDDFGGLEGQLSLIQSTGNGFWPIDQQGIGQVYQLQNQYPTTTGRPQVVCLESLKGTGPTQGQRFQLRFWPIADQSYDVNLQYYLLPDYVNGAQPYPYGGAAHAELYREAVLKAAEQYQDDAAGIHTQLFQERLAASIDFDRRQKAQTLGYNPDRSDMRERNGWRFTQHGWSTVKVGGVQY